MNVGQLVYRVVQKNFPQAACPADAQPISQSRKVLAQFSEFLLLYPVKRFDHLQD